MAFTSQFSVALDSMQAEFTCERQAYVKMNFDYFKTVRTQLASGHNVVRACFVPQPMPQLLPPLSPCFVR